MLIVALLPWVLLILALPFIMWVRGPRVRDFGPPVGGDAPFVSIIVPARNEATNISMCVASLMNSVYPRREIIVVDDDSVDGTGDIVRILEEHSNGDLRIVNGEPLPPDWLGKPWACWQGYRQARGDLLLFTDADTRHDDTLLGHAVGALLLRNADMVSILPRQLMLSFWERLILPHIFVLIMTRYPDLNRVNRARRSRDVIANGQFMLIRRSVYEAIGGHEAVRGEVVDDQSIAQQLHRAGRRVFLAFGEDMMETRMYRSLGGIVEGWSKNLAAGARDAAPGFLRGAAPWLAAAVLLALWVVPPLFLPLSLFVSLAPQLLGWSFLVTALSVLYWVVLLVRMRVPPLYALGYPFAAIAVVGLLLRSALRGTRVEWKGRAYEIEPPPRPARPASGSARPT